MQTARALVAQIAAQPWDHKGAPQHRRQRRQPPDQRLILVAVLHLDAVAEGVDREQPDGRVSSVSPRLSKRVPARMPSAPKRVRGEGCRVERRDGAPGVVHGEDAIAQINGVIAPLAVQAHHQLLLRRARLAQVRDERRHGVGPLCFVHPPAGGPSRVRLKPLRRLFADPCNKDTAR